MALRDDVLRRALTGSVAFRGVVLRTAQRRVRRAARLVPPLRRLRSPRTSVLGPRAPGRVGAGGRPRDRPPPRQRCLRGEGPPAPARRLPPRVLGGGGALPALGGGGLARDAGEARSCGLGARGALVGSALRDEPPRGPVCAWGERSLPQGGARRDAGAEPGRPVPATVASPDRRARALRKLRAPLWAPAAPTPRPGPWPARPPACRGGGRLPWRGRSRGPCAAAGR